MKASNSGQQTKHMHNARDRDSLIKGICYMQLSKGTDHSMQGLASTQLSIHLIYIHAAILRCVNCWIPTQARVAIGN